ncbi:MAG: putative metal-binding protein [Gaiellaceae bacterium]
MSVAQAIDPAVSRAKFEREVSEFQDLAADYGARGWFLAEATFPTVLVVLAAPHVKPPPVVTGVLLDYTDYDFRPPSVKLVDPFSRQPFRFEELPTQLLRQVEAAGMAVPMFQLPPGVEAPKVMVNQPLMQPDSTGEAPFLCIAGVREYHDHPGHSGDAWDLHRTAGAGRLVRILEVLDTYALRPINGYNVQLVTQITGFAQSEVPA